MESPNPAEVRIRRDIQGSCVMLSRFCIIFAILYLTAVLILGVYLRSAENRTFYRLCVHEAEQNRLNRELRDKQLRLENMINPIAISQRLEHRGAGG